MKLTRSKKRAAGALAIAAALAAIVAPVTASGSTDTTEPATTEPATTDVGAEGCGPEAVTDQADRSAERPIAHCEPGYPEPQPLAEPTTIRLTAATQGEYLAPVLLGNAFGEFEKENLTVEILQMPFADGMAQLGAEQADAANGGPFASFMNGVGSGLELRYVLANYSAFAGGDVTTPQSGLWVRRDAFSDPENPDLAELAGQHIANSLGSGTVAVYWMGAALEEAGISLADVTFDAIAPADQFQALEGGAVVGAYMLDPFWTQVAEYPDEYVLVAVQPGEPNGGIFFGPTLLEDNPEAGHAFVRAYIRTINTYLQPGYHDDEDVIAALAEAIPVDPAQLLAGNELRFEWEIREGLMEELQRWFIELDSQTVDVIPEDQLVDRSFYLEAVGAEG